MNYFKYDVVFVEFTEIMSDLENKIHNRVQF